MEIRGTIKLRWLNMRISIKKIKKEGKKLIGIGA